jgi:hypothetical protein
MALSKYGPWQVLGKEWAKEIQGSLRRRNEQDGEWHNFNHRWDGYQVTGGGVSEPHPSAGKFGLVMQERDASGKDIV